MRMKKSLVIINFKVYPEAVGKKSLTLARELSKVKSRKYELAVAPSLLTIKEIAEDVGIKRSGMKIYAQHGDIGLGAYTGSIPLQELKEFGVEGVIFNHSEKPLPLAEIVERVYLARRYGLKTIVCASSLFTLKRVAKLSPTYIAYEPRRLIGGSFSVTDAKPKLIIKAVEAVKKRSKKTKLLCGAGIHNREDVRHALLLGAEGVLIGHAVTKAEDQVRFLNEMLR